jgi:DNA-binding GntR family transcriptional regulator
MARHVILERRSLDAQATDVLRERIVGGLFTPGERLTEEALAGLLSISRGTVRSALQKLTFEGLVTQLPYRGWLVPPLTAQDAWELYTLRSSLEGLAARLVAEKITPAKGKVLREALGKLSEAAQAGRRAAVASADFEFHKTVIRLADHERLARQYGLVEQQVRIYIASCDALLPHLEQIVRQHEPMVEAICRAQGETAEHLAQAHNIVDGEALVRQLQRREGDRAAPADGRGGSGGRAALPRAHRHRGRPDAGGRPRRHS